MDRREFLIGAAALGAFAPAVLGQQTVKHKTIKPKRLNAGDTVALIAPSSGVTDQEFERAIQNLAAIGLKAKVGKYTRSLNGFLAGTDSERLDDLHAAFADRECSAVWCIRGGYGLTRILPQIDYALIKKNPKVVIGFSDITALLVAIDQNTGLVTFHGPVGTSLGSEYTRKRAADVLMTPSPSYKIEASGENSAREGLLFKTQVIAQGKARGRLTGGNLSLITAMAGTPYGLRDTKGKLLFIEDVGERPYRIDRMFVQLKQSVNLNELSGIALGIFDRCDAPDDKSQTVIDVVRDHLGGLGIPVIYGLSFGHIRDLMTLPLGIDAELDTSKATITLTEPAVI